MPRPTIRMGVVGTGNMGTNHVRVCQELPEIELVGICDIIENRARAVAERHGTTAYSFPELLDAVDAMCVAVPTDQHYESVLACIEADLDVLVEKPFVDTARQGRSLIDLADGTNAIIQVGHIERFNPAVQELFALHNDIDLIAVDAHRLGPPPDRDIEISVVLDLMIHDIDILLQLLDEPIEIEATGTPDGEFATATIESRSGQIGRLAASRVTQEKVRTLSISGTEERVSVNFINQSLEICRQSAPEYVRKDGSVNYRHETIVENLVVEHREPLKNQLEAFVSAVRNRSQPPVTARDGLRALEIAQRIEGIIRAPKHREPIVPLH